MAIVQIDPFALQRQLLRPLLEDTTWPQITAADGLNIYEENDVVYVEASLPGIPEDKIDITYEDGVLHICGKQEQVQDEKKKNRIVHRMQRVSSFDYTTYLPRPIDDKRIEATVKNGVLTIKAPVAEAVKAKKISVKAQP
jgi:HSP20 family protein